MKKVYISGPMTGIPGHNFAAFDEAVGALESRGLSVISPADIARKGGISEKSNPDEGTLRAIKQDDLNSLQNCDLVFMLKGWEDSIGARAEHEVAHWLGIEVEYEAETRAGNDPKGKAGDKKAPLWLLPPVALEETAWVHGLGARKYKPYNWRTTPVKASTYISAILRHLQLGYARGENADPESGKSHLAHIAACCNILIDAAAHGTLVDDRAVRTEIEFLNTNQTE